MKWLAAGLLICTLLLSAGCSGPMQQPQPTTQPPRVYTWERRMLVDLPECALELTRLQPLPSGDWLLTISCSNRLPDQVLFSCQDLMLDGWLIRDFWGEEFPGNTQRSCQILLPVQEVLGGGEYPQRLDMTVRIFSQADLNQGYLCSQSFTLYGQGAKPGAFQSHQSPLQEGSCVLADNSGCSVCLVYRATDDAGQHFTCLLENKTRQSLAFRIHSLEGEGEALDMLWTVQLPPGGRGSRELLIPTEASQGELSLHVQKLDKWFSDVLVDERFVWRADQ